MPNIINEISPEHLAKLDQIDRDCITMHIPTPPKTFINMQVHDKNGNLLTDYKAPSRSWVRNAYNFLANQFLVRTSGSTYEAGSLRLKQSNGSLEASDFFYNNNESCVVGSVGTTTNGILVGSDDTAESFEHYSLQALISHGVTSGTLSYAAQSPTELSYNSGSKTWIATLVRIMNNNSGSDITVKELGLFDRSGQSGHFIMLSRDVLSTPLTIPNAGQLTVTYTIEITFPA